MKRNDFTTQKIKNPQLVFVDLDGTLINTSTGLQLAMYYFKNRLISFRTFMYFISMAMKYKKYNIDLNAIHKIGLEHADTLEKIIIEKRVEEIFTQCIIYKFNATVLKRIKNHINNNDYLVLMTGSHMLFCNHIAQYIPFNKILANEFLESKTHYLPQYKNPIAYREEKLNYAKAIAQDLQYPLSNAISYADSHSDTDLMKIVGRPIAVNPDKKLKKEAKKRGWEIINDKTSVKLTEQLFKPQGKNTYLVE